MTASLLLLAAASSVISASSPSQQESARHSTQIAEHMKSTGATLSSAITAAEKQVDGRAIAVRMAMGNSPYLAQLLRTERENAGSAQPGERRPTDGATQPDQRRPADGATQPNQRRPADGATQPVPPRDRDANRDRQSDSTEYQAESMYAIVTCVIDQARVREVVVEFPSKKVIGVYATPALRSVGGDGSDQEQYDQATATTMVRATDLMNATVRNQDGVRVGDIDDLVLDPDTDRLLYGVLRRGGFLGMGESRYAIAPAMFDGLQDGTVETQLSSSDFSNRSGFSNNNWPKQYDAAWSRNKDRGANDRGRDRDRDRDLDRDRNQDRDGDRQEAKQIAKVSEIIGSDVHCTDENNFGVITDLIVDPKRGLAVYAVVKANHGTLVVPVSLLERFDSDYRLDLSLQEARKKPLIEENREPNWNDARWNRELRESYDMQDRDAGSTPRPTTPPAQPRPR